MHLWRTTTSTFAMLEHDRGTSSTACNRRRCRPSFGTDVRMRCRGPTFVRGAALGVPPLRRNHLSLRVRHRGPNVAKAPRASHPARAAGEAVVASRWPPRVASGPTSSHVAVPSRKSRRRVIRVVGAESPSRDTPRKNVLDNVPPDQREAGANRAVCDSVATARSDRRQRQSSFPSDP